MKKVLIIDDHDTFRASLKQIIGRFREFDVVGEAADARQGEAATRQFGPDLIVVDLSLPDKSGIQLTRILKDILPTAGIVIVSMHAKIDYLLAAIKAGAKGYIVKESAASCLEAAFEAALRDEYYLDPVLSSEIAVRLLEAPEQDDAADQPYGNLTSREQEILRLLARGISTKDIAERLFISPKTVSNHRTNIMGKLDLHSTADLVRYAVQLGLIEGIV